ncbi:MAG: IS1634 family transposase [Roseburia sp.]|nr:IS1634 family transposase [Anaeroplasma bactoclasticum]MCM1196933.1 IS1634 family transposase [Roseburia sp.]MCM1557468.1 IS1634 family transposase [Anaeroplasma bactoclasticum]
MIDSGIADPISYFSNVVKKMNEQAGNSKDLQIGDASTSKNAGYFLVKAMFDLLNMDRTMNIVGSNYKCHYEFFDLFKTLCYAQMISPGSKLKAFERVIPNLYGVNEYSYDQILDFTSFIGADYHKYIEVLNHHINEIWGRKTDKVYFDCTNYYFEIDLENEFLRKGPSKENQKAPLLGQALLLDANQIPLDTEFYPGNESEKPLLRKRIEDMKNKNNICGKVIQVADKGLNCARNIYAAVMEAHDGYIFSKSIKGKSLTEEQKRWILESDDELNRWSSVTDNEGKVLYRYKTVKYRGKNNKVKDYGIYEYHCKLDENDTKETHFTVKEKRIVTYNPTLAKKQKLEILKELDKLKKLVSYKAAIHEDLGDVAKYLNIEAKDMNGKKVKIATSINEDKLNDDLAFAGYNMIITSELDADPIDIYKTYHNLWRIEESFRLLKTYLEARPVFVSNQSTIYGHFLICYFSLTLIRLLELKIFNDEIPASHIFNFIRQYNITKNFDGSFINNATSSSYFYKIKEKLGLSKLGNVYLSKRDIDLLLKTEFDI